MVYTRSGRSTNPSNETIENQNPLDILYTISLMSALYKDEHVSNLYKKFITMSGQSKNTFLKELKEQYDLLQTAKTIF
jgi:hypothetical protein